MTMIRDPEVFNLREAAAFRGAHEQTVRVLAGPVAPNAAATARPLVVFSLDDQR